MKSNSQSGKDHERASEEPFLDCSLSINIIDYLLRFLDGQNKILCIIISVIFIFLLVRNWLHIFREYSMEMNSMKDAHNKQGKNQYKSDDLKKYNKLKKEKAENEENYEQNCKTLKTKFLNRCFLYSLCLLLPFISIISQLDLNLPKTEDAINKAPVYNDGNNTPEPTTGTLSIDGNVPTPEQLAEMENVGFILEEPDRIRSLSDQDKNRVFYISTTDSKVCKNEVNRHFSDIYAINRKNTLNLASQIELNIIDFASKKEEQFLHEQEMANVYKRENDYFNWAKTVPSSSTLQDIMELREQFSRVDVNETVKFSGKLCFLMANSNQAFALEYDHQNGIPETVIYYYSMSIIWTEDALSYGDIKKTSRAEYYGYIKGRYKDISDYILNNLSRFNDKKEALELQEKAWAIYQAM